MSTEHTAVDAEKIAREIVAVLGPRVPSSVTDTGARWEWQHALELSREPSRDGKALREVRMDGG